MGSEEIADALRRVAGGGVTSRSAARDRLGGPQSQSWPITPVFRPQSGHDTLPIVVCMIRSPNGWHYQNTAQLALPYDRPGPVLQDQRSRRHPAEQGVGAGIHAVRPEEALCSRAPAHSSKQIRSQGLISHWISTTQVRTRLPADLIGGELSGTHERREAQSCHSVFMPGRE